MLPQLINCLIEHKQSSVIADADHKFLTEMQLVRDKFILNPTYTIQANENRR